MGVGERSTIVGRTATNKTHLEVLHEVGHVVVVLLLLVRCPGARAGTRAVLAGRKVAESVHGLRAELVEDARQQVLHFLRLRGPRHDVRVGRDGHLHCARPVRCVRVQTQKGVRVKSSKGTGRQKVACHVLLGVLMWITVPSSLKIFTSSMPFISVNANFFNTPPSFLSSTHTERESARERKRKSEEDAQGIRRVRRRAVMCKPNVSRCRRSASSRVVHCEQSFPVVQQRQRSNGSNSGNSGGSDSGNSIHGRALSRPGYRRSNCTGGGGTSDGKSTIWNLFRHPGACAPPATDTDTAAAAIAVGCCCTCCPDLMPQVPPQASPPTRLCSPPTDLCVPLFFRMPPTLAPAAFPPNRF